jgi:hypothetical protein
MDAQRLFKSFLATMSSSLRLFRDFCGLASFLSDLIRKSPELLPGWMSSRFRIEEVSHGGYGGFLNRYRPPG